MKIDSAITEYATSFMKSINTLVNQVADLTTKHRMLSERSSEFATAVTC